MSKKNLGKYFVSGAILSGAIGSQAVSAENSYECFEEACRLSEIVFFLRMQSSNSDAEHAKKIFMLSNERNDVEKLLSEDRSENEKKKCAKDFLRNVKELIKPWNKESIEFAERQIERQTQRYNETFKKINVSEKILCDFETADEILRLVEYLAFYFPTNDDYKFYAQNGGFWRKKSVVLLEKGGNETEKCVKEFLRCMREFEDFRNTIDNEFKGVLIEDINFAQKKIRQYDYITNITKKVFGEQNTVGTIRENIVKKEKKNPGYVNKSGTSEIKIGDKNQDNNGNNKVPKRLQEINTNFEEAGKLLKITLFLANRYPKINRYSADLVKSIEEKISIDSDLASTTKSDTKKAKKVKKFLENMQNRMKNFEEKEIIFAKRELERHEKNDKISLKFLVISARISSFESFLTLNNSLIFSSKSLVF